MRRFGRDARGQSLVETALALPLLLLLVLGIGDLGRFAYYAIAVSHAARDAAAYAARTGNADLNDVHASVCVEIGLAAAECANAVLVTVTPAATETTVRVVYQFTLITGTIADRVGFRTIPLTAVTTFPGYTR